MTLDHLTPEDDIFADEDVLRDMGEQGTSYEPNELLKRDDLLNEYLHAFQEVIKGKRPRNVFVYGRTGIGKTVGTRLVLERLREDASKYDYLNIKTVHLECKALNTSYQVAANLVNKFRPAEDQITPTGYPEGMIYDMLWEELRQIDATHVLIALDEIDQIGDDDNILYKLPRCNNGNNPNVSPRETKVGIIGITNDATFEEGLDARVQNSLCDKKIKFHPYNATELRAILRRYAAEAFNRTEATDYESDEGFTSDVLDSAVIGYTAAKIAQRSGSVRTALDLLYYAGDLARRENATQVLERHAKEAEEKVQNGKLVQQIANLPNQSKLVIYTVLQMSRRGVTPARTGDVYDEYQKYAKEFQSNVVTKRMIRKILSELVENGYLSDDIENDGVHGGRYRHIDVGTIDEAIFWRGLSKNDSEFTKLTGFPSDYQEDDKKPRQTTLT